MRKVESVEKNEGGWEDKRISEIVATNINASQPPKCQPTGISTDHAKKVYRVTEAGKQRDTARMSVNAFCLI